MHAVVYMACKHACVNMHIPLNMQAGFFLGRKLLNQNSMCMHYYREDMEQLRELESLLQAMQCSVDV